MARRKRGSYVKIKEKINSFSLEKRLYVSDIIKSYKTLSPDQIVVKLRMEHQIPMNKEMVEEIINDPMEAEYYDIALNKSINNIFY